MSRALPTLCAAAFIGVLTLIPHTPAFAGQTIDPSTLNPPPPSFETCMATGSGAVCRGQRPLVDPPAPFGILCGSSQNPIDLIEADTGSQDATRYYDTQNNLVRRVIRDVFVGTLTNPVTGAYVNLDQRSDEVDKLSIPGDLNSGTVTFIGPVRISSPSGGTVLIDAGRGIGLADGTQLQISGQHPFHEYFDLGMTAALEPICAAVGAPQTS
jgi:hypothetical protein